MKTPRIVVVGSVNADMVVKSGRLPGPGETVIGGEFIMVPGGKGANQAVAACRLGAEVTLVAKVGQDPLGDEAIENYRRERIHTDLILRRSDRRHWGRPNSSRRTRRESDFGCFGRQCNPHAGRRRSRGRSHSRSRCRSTAIGDSA